jgi:hypothetical protein
VLHGELRGRARNCRMRTWERAAHLASLQTLSFLDIFDTCRAATTCSGTPSWFAPPLLDHTTVNRCPVLQAVSSASAECISSGNAYGCAAAFAYARAWAEAVASAHAGAFSLAINKCTCRGEPQEVIASNYGSASVFEELVVDVEAVASAKVCVKGNASAHASVLASCQQTVYADVFANVRSHGLPLIACTLGRIGAGMPASASLWSANKRAGGLKRGVGHAGDRVGRAKWGHRKLALPWASHARLLWVVCHRLI